MNEVRTVVTDVDIPFGRMVMIILKVMLASIPAILLVFVCVMLVLVLGRLGALLGGMG